VFRGDTAGSGSSTRVTIFVDHAAGDAERSASREIAVCDMPESVAWRLLSPTALDDAALDG
jgi:hypothetical protein